MILKSFFGRLTKLISFAAPFLESQQGPGPLLPQQTEPPAPAPEPGLQPGQLGPHRGVPVLPPAAGPGQRRGQRQGAQSRLCPQG